MTFTSPRMRFNSTECLPAVEDRHGQVEKDAGEVARSPAERGDGFPPAGAVSTVNPSRSSMRFTMKRTALLVVDDQDRAASLPGRRPTETTTTIRPLSHRRLCLEFSWYMRDRAAVQSPKHDERGIVVLRAVERSMNEDPVQLLAGLMRKRRTVVLSGAGISTESGIPDYRGPQGALRNRRPIQYREFIESEAARRRYWARSAAGWARVDGAKPNARSPRGCPPGGSWCRARGDHPECRRPAPGRGKPARARAPRHAGTRALPGVWTHRAPPPAAGKTRGRQPGLELFAPGGGAGWGCRDTVRRSWKISPCPGAGIAAGSSGRTWCSSAKTCPQERVEAAGRMIDEADVLLVTGSSLAVFSGYRFVIRAMENDTPVAIINRGPTRADCPCTRSDRPGPRRGPSRARHGAGEMRHGSTRCL